jgi:hypothetical protein
MFWLGRFTRNGKAIYQTLKTTDDDLVRDINRVVVGFDEMEKLEND